MSGHGGCDGTQTLGACGADRLGFFVQKLSRTQPCTRQLISKRAFKWCAATLVIRTRTFAVFALELEVVPLSQDHSLLVALCEHINKTLDRCSHTLDLKACDGESR